MSQSGGERERGEGLGEERQREGGGESDSVIKTIAPSYHANTREPTHHLSLTRFKFTFHPNTHVTLHNTDALTLTEIPKSCKAILITPAVVSELLTAKVLAWNTKVRSITIKKHTHTH